MTATPEHDKIDAIGAVNPTAAELLHVLINEDGFEIVNNRYNPPLSMPLRDILANVIGLDTEAYRREKLIKLGVVTGSQTTAAAPVDVNPEGAVTPTGEATEESPESEPAWDPKPAAGSEAGFALADADWQGSDIPAEVTEEQPLIQNGSYDFFETDELPRT